MWSFPNELLKKVMPRHLLKSEIPVHGTFGFKIISFQYTFKIFLKIKNF